VVCRFYDFYPGVESYTRTVLTVNTIKKGLPPIREAVSINRNPLEGFDFVNLVGIRINDVDTTGNTWIKGMHRS
jgi:hypothetical protein